MKALITGSQGFVGRYLRGELAQHGYEVVGVDLQPGEGTIQADLMDAEGIRAIIRRERPDTVFHLSAQADVGRSWKEPALTMQLNVVAAVNLLEAVRLEHPAARLVMVGSSDQYGRLGAAGARVTEEMELQPASPYAVSKRAQEEMARLYAGSYGLHICMTRSFNHGGAGQRLGFMIPDFAHGIVQIERGRARELLVGNLSARRDFSHVKDVARAYRLIAERGESGQVYNVGSGETHSAQEVLELLRGMAKCDVPVRQDPARMRPSDTPVICCDHGKLTRDTGWEPELGIRQILADTLAYYRGLES